MTLDIDPDLVRVEDLRTGWSLYVASLLFALLLLLLGLLTFLPWPVFRPFRLRWRPRMAILFIRQAHRMVVDAFDGTPQSRLLFLREMIEFRDRLRRS